LIYRFYFDVKERTGTQAGKSMGSSWRSASERHQRENGGAKLDHGSAVLLSVRAA
jgi:hypothetical protein